jgi:hypothetical protein
MTPISGQWNFVDMSQFNDINHYLPSFWTKPIMWRTHLIELSVQETDKGWVYFAIWNSGNWSTDNSLKHSNGDYKATKEEAMQAIEQWAADNDINIIHNNPKE